MHYILSGRYSLMTKFGLARGDPAYIAPEIERIVELYRYNALYSAINLSK